MWDELYVVGAGGHGKVVADGALASGLAKLKGFVDDAPAALGRTPLGLAVHGDLDWLIARASSTKLAVLFGIGDGSARQRIALRCRRAHVELATVIHPAATVASSARVGAGTVVIAGAVVNPDAIIGEGCIINTGAIVEHDCLVGDYTHVSPNAAIGGGVRLGARVHVGAGATVLPGVSVGDDTVVGAGAVVLRPLPAGVVAVGVPARVIGGRDP